MVAFQKNSQEGSSRNAVEEPTGRVDKVSYTQEGSSRNAVEEPTGRDDKVTFSQGRSSRTAVEERPGRGKLHGQSSLRDEKSIKLKNSQTRLSRYAIERPLCVRDAGEKLSSLCHTCKDRRHKRTQQDPLDRLTVKHQCFSNVRCIILMMLFHLGNARLMNDYEVMRVTENLKIALDGAPSELGSIHAFHKLFHGVRSVKMDHSEYHYLKGFYTCFTDKAKAYAYVDINDRNEVMINYYVDSGHLYSSTIAYCFSYNGCLLLTARARQRTKLLIIMPFSDTGALRIFDTSKLSFYDYYKVDEPSQSMPEQKQILEDDMIASWKRRKEAEVKVDMMKLYEASRDFTIQPTNRAVDTLSHPTSHTEDATPAPVSDAPMPPNENPEQDITKDLIIIEGPEEEEASAANDPNAESHGGDECAPLEQAQAPEDTLSTPIEALAHHSKDAALPPKSQEPDPQAKPKNKRRGDVARNRNGRRRKGKRHNYHYGLPKKANWLCVDCKEPNFIFDRESMIITRTKAGANASKNYHFQQKCWKPACRKDRPSGKQLFGFTDKDVIETKLSQTRDRIMKSNVVEASWRRK